MHLLGTSGLVFLLLPLVFSCKSTKTVQEISEDYSYVIQKQLNHINSSIYSKVESCKEKKLTLPKLSLIERIIVSCNRLPKHINGTLQDELSSLMKNIHKSLGCPCSPNEAEQEERWRDSLSVQRKFCKLQRLLTTIRNVYQQHNSQAINNNKKK